MDETLWRFITLDLPDNGSALLGVEQHGFVVPALYVVCDAGRREVVYHPAGALDADLPMVALPDTRLTQAGLVEAARIYLRRSGEYGCPLTPEVTVETWAVVEQPGAPVFDADGRLLAACYLHPAGEVACARPGVWRLPVRRFQESAA